MLVEFSFENFRSYKEKQTFSLLASKDKSLLLENTFNVEKNINLLKTATFYGANASGKSGFFMALSTFLEFAVLSGPQGQRGEPIRITPFLLDLKNQNEPTFFEIIFFLGNPEKGISRYRYGIKLDRNHVIEEYLFVLNKVRETFLFRRDNQTIKTNKRLFLESETFSTKTVRENASYLSVCAQNNGNISGDIINYFRTIFITSGINPPPVFTLNQMDRSENLPEIVKFLKIADIQVVALKKQKKPININFPDPDFVDFVRKKFPDGTSDRIIYVHNLYKDQKLVGTTDFTEDDESVGTIKLFNYAGIILSVLKNGGVLLIDEFDSSLHPLLVEHIINLFNDPSINKNNAQLIVSCQALTFMTNRLFRRDQIWLCEKNRYGASEIYSLMDFEEPVRKDATFNKSYMAGKYGAVPQVDILKFQMGMNN